MPASFPKLKFVAACQLPTVAPFPCGDRVRMPNLKHVLWTIWAHEGETLPRRTIADLTGLSPCQTDRCVQALLKLGIVTTERGHTSAGTSACVFSISTTTLLKYQPREQREDPSPKRCLSIADARRVHELHADKVSKAEIARTLGVSEATIRSILTGRRWKEAMPTPEAVPA